MSAKRPTTAAMGWMLLGMCLLAPSVAGQTTTQTFALRAGWNAIHLEVEPAAASPAEVFAGLPVASVWTRAERTASAEFIQDPGEPEFNRAGWLVWFPPGRPEAFLGNLHAVKGNSAYLIKLTNSVAAWTVSGRPALRRADWVPDAYNLRGFAVAAVAPPTFADFFRSGRAHCNADTGVVEKVYRLDAQGHWSLVGPGELMRRGEACWVYSRGASDFAGPVEVVPERGDGVDFGVDGEQFKLELRNRTAASQNVTVALRAPTKEKVLAYRSFNPAQGGYVWSELPASHTVAIPAGEDYTVHLAVRRSVLANAAFSAQLEVSDTGGSSRIVPVTAAKADLLAHSFQGLWVGDATVDAVSEANGADPAQPKAVRTSFPLRMLVHVDGQGQVRFLKEVIQMWRDGSYTNDARGQRVVDKPGQYVLLTDDRLIGQFGGATLRDGVPVGRRLSTAGFDFDAGTTNCVRMTGTFGVSNRLAVTLTVAPNAPTNPFKHKYHPDHDNLDARFVALTNNYEAYAVTRQIELQLGGPETGGGEPDVGYAVMHGVYRETLTGLHKNPLHLQGAFRLTRASQIGALNPSPIP